MTTGIKGSDVYASTTNKVLDLSVMLNRGLAETEIRTAIDEIVATGDPTQLEDAFVLLFQTRDVRGGKGERDLFQHLCSDYFDLFCGFFVVVGRGCDRLLPFQREAESQSVPGGQLLESSSCHLRKKELRAPVD